VHRLTFLGGGVVLLGGCKRDSEPKKPARAQRRREGLVTSHQTFTNDEFAILSAACERVLPKDEDPGALDANVPQYVDRALGTKELQTLREQFVGGLAVLDRRAQGAHQQGFAELKGEQQDELIAALRDAAPGTGEAKFYELLVVLTLEGFLGDPSYGGNRDRVGWRLVGFQTSEPPPGHDGHKALSCNHGGG
jgi:gluconate 2-dehydrogenase gamma chain